MTHIFGRKKSHHCSTAFQIILPAKLRHISHKYANSGYCVCSSIIQQQSHTYEQKARRVCLFFFAYLVLLYELA